MKSFFTKHIPGETSIAPLVVFRIVFGLVMLTGTIRFWAKGWIETQYIQPQFYFSYYGFEWVHPYSANVYLFSFWPNGNISFFYSYRVCISLLFGTCFF